ncbi:MAG: glycoside hydrolase family 2 TIM barrel-domain containing protein [Planctomycetota bacterium]
MTITVLLAAFLVTQALPTLSLNGAWQIRYDPRNRGLEQGWAEQPPTGGWYEERVPACIEEYETGAGYDGVVWYRTTFTVPASWQFEHLWLRFTQVNYRTTAWLNGTALGTHDGGYTPFRFELTASVQPGENHLLLRVVDPGAKEVDGLKLSSHPHAKEDWYFNHGGVIGDVTLVPTRALAIDDVFVAGDPERGRADLQVRLLGRLADAVPDTIMVRAELLPEDGVEQLAAAEVAAQGSDDTVALSLPIDRAARWSLEHPKLYDVRVTLARAGEVLDQRLVRTGFRTFTVQGNRFELNGKPILLRGVLYQPYYPGTLARPPSADWVERDVDRALDAGFNLMRQHERIAPRALVEYADRKGMLLFSEPSIGWLAGAASAGELAPLCLQEVRGLIERDRNSPSVVMWGMLNEGSGQAHALEDRLTAFARSLDPTRIVCDDSGGWQNGAYYLAPHSMTHVAYDDVHAYLPHPERAVALHELRSFGRRSGRSWSRNSASAD